MRPSPPSLGLTPLFCFFRTGRCCTSGASRRNRRRARWCGRRAARSAWRRPSTSAGGAASAHRRGAQHFRPGVKGYGNIKVVGVCTRKRPGELLAVALPPMHITRRRRRDTTTVPEIRFNIGYITPVRAAFCPLPARRPSHHLHSRCVTPTPPTGGQDSLCQSHCKLGARPAFPGYGAPGMPMERELRDHAKEKIQRMINTRGYPLSYNLKAAGLCERQRPRSWPRSRRGSRRWSRRQRPAWLG